MGRQRAQVEAARSAHDDEELLAAMSLAADADAVREVLAALSLELVRAQEHRQEQAVLEDRDRIARDMHDQVVQRLFAVGLGLASLAASCPDRTTRDRLGALTDEVDQAIRTIRRTIFELQRREEPVALRTAVCEVVRDLAPSLGCSPDLRLLGPLDVGVDAELAAQVVAVLREALTDVARHAHAPSVRVDVELRQDGVLSVTVTDDGVGTGDAVRRAGLADLRERAERLGGTCELTSPVPPRAGGAQVRWTAPATGVGGPARRS